MTVEEAIKSLIFIRDSVLNSGEVCDTTTEENALDMAIEALNYKKDMEGFLKDGMQWVKVNDD